MKFKEWFDVLADYVINFSEFTCVCPDGTKWHFYVKGYFLDKPRDNDWVDSVEFIRKKIEDGWGPANYYIVRVEVHPRIGTMEYEGGRFGSAFSTHFQIELSARK